MPKYALLIILVSLIGIGCGTQSIPVAGISGVELTYTQSMGDHYVISFYRLDDSKFEVMTEYGPVGTFFDGKNSKKRQTVSSDELEILLDFFSSDTIADFKKFDVGFRSFQIDGCHVSISISQGEFTETVNGLSVFTPHAKAHEKLSRPVILKLLGLGGLDPLEVTRLC